MHFKPINVIQCFKLRFIKRQKIISNITVRMTRSYSIQHANCWLLFVTFGWWGYKYNGPRNGKRYPIQQCIIPFPFYHLQCRHNIEKLPKRIFFCTLGGKIHFRQPEIFYINFSFIVGKRHSSYFAVFAVFSFFIFLLGFLRSVALIL